MCLILNTFTLHFEGINAINTFRWIQNATALFLVSDSYCSNKLIETTIWQTNPGPTDCGTNRPRCRLRDQTDWWSDQQTYWPRNQTRDQLNVWPTNWGTNWPEWLTRNWQTEGLTNGGTNRLTKPCVYVCKGEGGHICAFGHVCIISLYLSRYLHKFSTSASTVSLFYPNDMCQL